MPQFSYKARRRSGELVEGVLDVADRSAALVQIQRSGLFPVAVADEPAMFNAHWLFCNVPVLPIFNGPCQAPVSLAR